VSPEGLTDTIPTNAFPTLQNKAVRKPLKSTNENERKLESYLQHHRVAKRSDQSVCKVEAIAQRHTASKQTHSNFEERTCFNSNSRRNHSTTRNLWFYSLKQA